MTVGSSTDSESIANSPAMKQVSVVDERESSCESLSTGNLTVTGSTVVSR